MPQSQMKIPNYFLTKRQTKLLTIYFLTFLLLYVFSPIITILRINRFDVEGNIAWLFLGFRTVFLGLLSFLIITSNKISRINFFILFFGFMLFWGQIVGLGSGNNLSFMLSDLLRGIFVLVTLILFSNLRFTASFLERVINSFCLFVIISFTVSEIWLYILSPLLGLRTYAGLGSQALLLPLIYYYFKRRKWRTLFSLLLIFLSGKRGVFLVSLVVIFLSFLLRKSSKKTRLNSKAIIIAMMVSLFIITCLIIVFANIIEEFSKSNLPIFIEKYVYSLSVHDIEDLYSISSGRLSQIQAVLEEIKTDPARILLFGEGHGAAIEFRVQVGERTFFFDSFKNIHFSPIRLILIYGAFWTSVIYVYLSIVGIKSILLFKKTRKYIDMVIGIFIIAFLIYTFFVYEILQEPLFWLIVSIAIGRIGKNATKHQKHSTLEKNEGRIFNEISCLFKT